MNSFVIPSSSSLSLCNVHQHSRLFSSSHNPRSKFEFRRLQFGVETEKTSLKCNCSSKKTGGTDSGENENRSVLDAFFLGKALVEVFNERIESTVGEVLSTIGKFQAEQQKQVQEIQEEVLERAKRAKDRAARETMEAQGLVAPKQAAVIVTSDSVTPTPTVESNAISKENVSTFSASSVDSEVEISGSSDDDSV